MQVNLFHLIPHPIDNITCSSLVKTLNYEANYNELIAFWHTRAFRKFAPSKVSTKYARKAHLRKIILTAFDNKKQEVKKGKSKTKCRREIPVELYKYTINIEGIHPAHAYEMHSKNWSGGSSINTMCHVIKNIPAAALNNWQWSHTTSARFESLTEKLKSLLPMPQGSSPRTVPCGWTLCLIAHVWKLIMRIIRLLPRTVLPSISSALPHSQIGSLMEIWILVSSLTFQV